MFAGCRRLRRIWRDGKALFRQLLLQIGGANIAGLFARSARCDVRSLPPSSSDLVERKSVVPPAPPADRRREHRGSSCSLRSLRCSLVAAVFVGSGGTEKRRSAISSCRSAARTSRV